MFKLLTQPHRNQVVTPLEKAVSGNDCTSIKNLLQQAERVPMYLFDLAASLGHTEAFDCLFALLPSAQKSFVITQTRVTHASLVNKQFKMFEHLVYTHKCYFKVDSLIDGYNNGIDEAIRLYLNVIYNSSFELMDSKQYTVCFIDNSQHEVDTQQLFKNFEDYIW